MMCGFGVSVTGRLLSVFSGDRQRDVRERRVDGGIRLVHRDPRPFNTIVPEADVRDPLGQGLDQVDRIFSTADFTAVTRLP